MTIETKTIYIALGFCNNSLDIPEHIQGILLSYGYDNPDIKSIRVNELPGFKYGKLQMVKVVFDYLPFKKPQITTSGFIVALYSLSVLLQDKIAIMGSICDYVEAHYYGTYTYYGNSILRYNGTFRTMYCNMEISAIVKTFE